MVTTRDFAQMLKSPEYRQDNGFMALGISQQDEPMALTAYCEEAKWPNWDSGKIRALRGFSPDKMQLGYLTNGLYTEHTPEKAYAALMAKDPIPLILVQPLNGRTNIGDYSCCSLGDWQLDVAGLFLKDLTLQNHIRSLLAKPIKLARLNPLEDRFTAAKTGIGLDRFDVAALTVITDDAGETPLHIAAKAGTLRNIKGGVTVLQLHQTKASPAINTQKIISNTALHTAAASEHLNQLKDKLTIDFIIREKAWDLLRQIVGGNQTPLVTGDWSKLSSYFSEWGGALPAFIEHGVVHLLYPKGRNKEAQVQKFWDDLDDDAKTVFKTGIRESFRGYIPEELKDICIKLKMPMGVGLPETRCYAISCS